MTKGNHVTQTGGWCSPVDPVVAGCLLRGAGAETCVCSRMQNSSACDAVLFRASWPFQTALPPVAVVTEMMDSWSFCLQVCLPGTSVHVDCRMTSLRNKPALSLPCLTPSMCASCLQVEFQVLGGTGGPRGLASMKSQDIPSPASLPRLYVPGLKDFFLFLMLFNVSVFCTCFSFYFLSRNALLSTCPPTELVTGGQMTPPLLPPPGSNLILSPVCPKHPYKTPSWHESLCVAMIA